jgi:hypothetical protein
MNLVAAIIAGVAGGYLIGWSLFAIGIRVTRGTERQLIGSWPSLLIFWLMILAGWAVGRGVWLALSPGNWLGFGYPPTSEGRFLGFAAIAAGSSAWWDIRLAGQRSNTQRQGRSAL